MTVATIVPSIELMRIKPIHAYSTSKRRERVIPLGRSVGDVGEFVGSDTGYSYEGPRIVDVIRLTLHPAQFCLSPDHTALSAILRTV
jgi:hypothetical protein